MEYQENVLCYEDYCRLRESVGWLMRYEESHSQVKMRERKWIIGLLLKK